MNFKMVYILKQAQRLIHYSTYILHSIYLIVQDDFPQFPNTKEAY